MDSDARQVLAAFLKAELDAWRDAGKARSEREWAEKVGLPPHDVRRARSGRNITLEKLQVFASALRVAPWQLLFPGFARDEPERFPTMSPEAISVALEVDRIEDDARRQKLAAGILTMLEGQATAPSPVAPPSPAETPTRMPARHR